MRYKVIALDLDGTLTNSKKEITPYTKEVLFQFQERGGKIVLASGRPTCGILPLAEELKLDEYGGFVLSFNGAKIIDYGSGEVIYDKTLSPDTVKQLYQLSKENDVTIMSYDHDIIITENAKDPFVKIEADISKMQIKEVQAFEQYINYPVNKCLMVAEGDYLAGVEKRVKQAVGEELSVYRSEPFFLEIMPNQIDKAVSLQSLLTHLHLRREDLAAFGDGFNDLTMIKFAGLGVAMSNGQEIVRKAADYVTHSNDEDGVAHAIHKFIFRAA